MKNKKIIIILASLIVLIGGIFLVNNIYQNKNKITNTKRKKQNNLAIMIKEDGATDYTKSNSKDIPKGDYVLNYEKSYCKNNGLIGDYDNSLGKVSFSFIGTDSCFLYFDYKAGGLLYETIEKRYNQDTSKTYLDLYTGDGADTYANPVYYYKDNVQNNNVLFGGFCWKIVRTTETGGVKVVYNGKQKDDVVVVPIEQSSYVNINNDANYPYTFNSTSKTWVSTNHDKSKTGTITFTVDTPGDYYLSYDVSSEEIGDYAKFYKNDTILKSYSGIVSGKLKLTGLTISDVIKVEYVKDSLGDAGNDTVTFSLGKAAGEPFKSCNNTGKDSQIDTEPFNNLNDSLAYVGYMYNTAYADSYDYKTIISSKSFSGSQTYGDGVTFKNWVYSFTNLRGLNVTSSNISILVGKYFCVRHDYSTGKCSSAGYIVGYSGTTIYYYILSASTTDGTTLANKNYVFGKSFNYANGSYKLSDTVALNSDTFITNKSNVNTHHYTCLSSETTCSSIYYVYYISSGTPYYITLTDGKSIEDVINEMLYADDVNTKNSTIKAYIDSWYESNLISYENKLEDTVFCNDRSISNLGGWDPNGGNIEEYLQFKNYNTDNKSLVCANETDRFSMSNAKAKLKHPIGLLSVPELSLANYGSTHYFNSGQNVWLGSPSHFDYRYPNIKRVVAFGWDEEWTYLAYGVRPSVSLKPNIEYVSGDGSFTNPFVIE